MFAPESVKCLAPLLISLIRDWKAKLENGNHSFSVKPSKHLILSNPGLLREPFSSEQVDYDGVEFLC